MLHQITVLKPDDSFVEAFFVSDSLLQELARISHIFELDYLNLAFLQEIEQRALSVCSRRIKSQQLTTIRSFATSTLDWFGELLALIDAIRKLHDPFSLSIRLN